MMSRMYNTSKQAVCQYETTKQLHKLSDRVLPGRESSDRSVPQQHVTAAHHKEVK